jgi:hypothetical protein
MPQRIVKRPMTDKERDFLTGRLRGCPTKAKRLRQGIVNAFLMWVFAMLIFVVGWKVMAWIARTIVHAELGWKRPDALWILIGGALLCAAYSIFSTLRWIKGWRDVRPGLRADLASGEVAEEHYEFNAAKRFQEPEHGGLMYFLRTVDNKVFVLFDYESQGLGAEGEDPLATEFRPCENLLLVRASHSEIVLSQNFSGAALEVGEPIELSVGPSKWPEWDCYCEVKWEELEQRYGGSRRKGR